MSRLFVENLQVSYAGRDGPVVALDGYSLEVAPGSLTVLLGESGCGKSTALNAIAGLLQPDSGRITLGEKRLFERSAGARGYATTPPNHRDIGMVFQSYALWPHLSVLENVMYPAKRRGANHDEASRAAVGDLLALARELGLRDADVVLQEEVPPGVELLLGMKRDATFGPVITLGIGGVLTEAWDDVQIRLGDCDHEVPDMLAALRHQLLLSGAGGRPAVDPADLAPTVARFARLVGDLGHELEAIDINPVIVRPDGKGPVVVDTVFFLADQVEPS